MGKFINQKTKQKKKKMEIMERWELLLVGEMRCCIDGKIKVEKREVFIWKRMKGKSSFISKFKIRYYE